MSNEIHALLSGIVDEKGPTVAVGKTDREYVRCGIRCELGIDIRRVTLMAFTDDLVAQISALRPGQPVACYGRLQLGEWVKDDGARAPQATVIASAILPAMRPERRPRNDKPADPQAALSRTASEADFDDQIGF
jgi:hypothetical protein